jgi:hypothetical protein
VRAVNRLKAGLASVRGLKNALKCCHEALIALHKAGRHGDESVRYPKLDLGETSMVWAYSEKLVVMGFRLHAQKISSAGKKSRERIMPNLEWVQIS